MPPVRFKCAILAGERPQTYALDHAATGIVNFLALDKSFLTPSLHLPFGRHLVLTPVKDER